MEVELRRVSQRAVAHLIRHSLLPLFLEGVRVNDLVPQSPQSHVGSLNKHNTASQPQRDSCGVTESLLYRTT